MWPLLKSEERECQYLLVTPTQELLTTIFAPAQPSTLSSFGKAGLILTRKPPTNHSLYYW